MRLFAKKETIEPALFLSHGWPEMPVEPCALRDFFLSAYSDKPRPRLALALSSRWRAPVAMAGANERPQLIRDFTPSDFRLEQLDYTPAGAPELAAKARSMMVAGGLSCKLDARRGLDCSIWGPLWLALPEESVRVCPLSLPESAGAEGFFRAGRALRALRREGVSVISCGQLFERERDPRALLGQAPEAGLLAMMAQCCAILRSGAPAEAMVAPLKEALGGAAGLGMASASGYLPLFFHLGLAFDGEAGAIAHESFAYGRLGNVCHWLGKDA